MPHDAKREARILDSIQHPSIVSVLETFNVAGGCFVITFPFMPYELDQLLRKQMLSPKDARNHLRELFAALQHLHAKGIIHRDVKPSNILLKSPRGPAYLADFGIAWSPTDHSEPAEDKFTDVGTTAYRPPELLFGHKSYGTKLDMWAAGCIAAQLVSLSKAPLFEAGDLGTELSLIRSIFSGLGTPDLESWPVRSLCGILANMILTSPLRRPLHFQTGARCSGSSMLRDRGLNCCPRHLQRDKTW